MVPLKKAMVLWNPESKKVKVVEHPASFGEDSRYAFSGGACYSIYDRMTNRERVLYLYQLAIQINMNDGVPMAHIMSEFCRIPEFIKSWNSIQDRFSGFGL